MTKPYKTSKQKILIALAFVITLGLVGPVLIEYQASTPKPTVQTKPSSLPYKQIGTSPIAPAEQQKKITQKLYSIELASTKNKTAAESLVQELKKKGIDAFYSPFHKEGHVRFRVRTGLYRSSKVAKRYQNKIGKLNIKSKIVRL